MSQAFQFDEFSMTEHDPFSLGDFERVVPTTESQREIWLSVKIGGEPANCAYNESVSLEMHGRLDTEALAAAMRQLITRHEALRAVISRDGQSMSFRCSLDWALQVQDFSSHPDPEGQSQTVLFQDVTTPFDLERGPLFRMQLIRFESEKHLLVFTAHHIVCDGWSCAVLLDDLGSFYSARLEGREHTPAEQPGYAAYALAERGEDGQRASKLSADYWLQQFQGDIPQVEYPTEKRRPENRSFEAHRLDFEVSGELLGRLKKTGSQHRATFVATLFAAFNAYMHRLTGKTDLAVGMPSAGQSATGAYYLVGHCVNTLPVRSQLDPREPFVDYLQRIRQTLLSAHDHRDFSFGTLVKRLPIERDASRVPLISILFNVDIPIDCKNFQGLSARFISNPRHFENFEVSLNAVDYGHQLVLETTYNTNLFSAEQIERRLREFVRFLESIADQPETPIGELEILPDDEKKLLFQDWNNTATATVFDTAGMVHCRVEAQAASHPDRLALEAEDRSLSYGELNARANQLARVLLERGVQPGSLVGICLHRHSDMVVALLATMKAGAAYVPIDPAYPAERICMILEDAAPPLIVSESDLGAHVRSATETPVFLIDESATLLQEQDGSNLNLELSAESLAYVIFTSGSTGRPKGVQISGRAFANFLVSMAHEPGFGAEQRLLAVTTMSFDIAGLEIFLPLTVGGTVVLAGRDVVLDPHRLMQALEEREIDCMQATPATWRMLLNTQWQGNPRLSILCGGEPFPPHLASALLSKCGALWNMYGPTETTVWSTLHRVTGVMGDFVPVGHPIENTKVFVMDEQLRPVPIGVEGQLCIGGLGLSDGYHQRPDLTQQAFFQSTLLGEERLYKTGDLARWLSTGDLEHRGRRDSQVKIRGFRIELGEIEAALGQLDGTRDVAVIVMEEQLGDPRLVAYLTWQEGFQLEVSAIRERLRQRLPSYMVPNSFVSLEQMPLTPAGKIDRKALPVPRRASTFPRLPAAERTQTDDEACIVAMFREILQVDEVGRDSDFFQLGGHSLVAIQLATRIAEQFDTDFSVATIFRQPTVRDLARAARAQSSEGEHERALVLQLSKGRSKLNLFFICGVNIYGELAEALGSPYNSYGVFVPSELGYLTGRDTGVPADFTAEKLARDYVEAIRQVQPKGPYCLAGVSFGGMLAYEIAQQLLKQGQEVKFLGLIDSLLPRSIHFRPDRYLSHHVSQFVAGDAVERGRYLGRIARKLMRKSAETSSGPHHAVDELVSEAGDFENAVNDLREGAYAVAMNRYDETIAPYPQKVTLFRATDHSEYPGYVIDKDCGWKNLVKGRLSVLDVPGTHLGILRGHAAQMIAEEVRRQFELIEASETKANS